MGADFTVIQAVRQQFGDSPAPEGLDDNAPFVGPSKEFPFQCPNVDPKEIAVLQFESVGSEIGTFGDRPAGRGRESERNIIRVNGVDIPGGITPGPRERLGNESFSLWKSHTLLVPGGLLRERNVLFIQAVHRVFFGAIDNFIVDNIVLFYKIRSNPAPVNRAGTAVHT